MLTYSAYVPGFIRIHFRYFKDSFRAWAVLFVAPFVAVKLSLNVIFDLLSTGGSRAWKFDLIALLIIGMCFYFAERNRKFRQFYVYFAPVVMTLGLLHWAGRNGGYLNAGYAVKAGLIAFFSYRVSKFTISKGYQTLSEGGDKNYRLGRQLYDQGNYDEAMPLLEKAAKRGHFKSLFLIGEAYERGLFFDRDDVRAAEYYLKSGQKGYRKANEKYREVFDRLTPEQKYEIDGVIFQPPI